MFVMRVISCMLYSVYIIMLSKYMITFSSVITALYSIEYYIDNVNITDRVVYFVLQELISQLVTPGTAGLYYISHVLRETSK